MQLYSEKRSIMNKLIGLLTCLCFSTNLAVAQNKDASSIIKFDYSPTPSMLIVRPKIPVIIGKLYKN